MSLVVVPLKADKVDEWKNWTKSLTGEKKQEFDKFNQRYGITRHDAWLAETPDGPIVVALHEGPGADSFLQKLGESDNDFDQSFAEKINEYHGMDLQGPPPGPMPEKMI